jgi:hypothetical protein
VTPSKGHLTNRGVIYMEELGFTPDLNDREKGTDGS